MDLLSLNEKNQNHCKIVSPVKRFILRIVQRAVAAFCLPPAPLKGCPMHKITLPKLHRVLATGASLFIFVTGISILKAEDAKPKTQETQNKGPDSTSETFGDWAVVCGTPAAESAERVCEVDTNVMIRGQTAPSARIAIGHSGKDKSMRVITLVPVNVSIPQGVSLTFEAGKPGLTLSFKSCAAGACFADSELSKDQLSGFRAATGRGTTGQISFTDPAGKPISFEFSLKGFDQAIDSWQKH